MSTQSDDLHRSLLRPFVLHTLRAAGFHSTKPSVLDTLINLTERHLLLLASTTAKHALNNHNDHRPTLTDVRMAMQECGVLVPVEGGAEEGWEEVLRRPTEALGEGGERRGRSEKRKREGRDEEDVRGFTAWFEGEQHREIKRVAGMGPNADAAAVGVGGGVVQAEDFLSSLKKRHYKGGDDSRLQGTVLGRQAEERERGVVIEGGPVQRLEEWSAAVKAQSAMETREMEGVAT